MVHYKLTAAAAALLAPPVMAAIPECAPTDNVVIVIESFGTDNTCAVKAWEKFFVPDTCYKSDTNKFYKAGRTETGEVTLSNYTDPACSEFSHMNVKQGYQGEADETNCLGEPSTEAATAWLTATGGFYRYKILCGTDTKTVQSSAALSTHTKLDCSDAKATGDQLWDTPIISSADGLCQQTAAAESTKYKCAETGEGEAKAMTLTVDVFATADCSGDPTVGSTYAFSSAVPCHSGAADYVSSDTDAATAGSVKKADTSGEAFCVPLDNTQIQCFSNMGDNGELTPSDRDMNNAESCGNQIAAAEGGAKAINCPKGVNECVRMSQNQSGQSDYWIPCHLMCGNKKCNKLNTSECKATNAARIQDSKDECYLLDIADSNCEGCGSENVTLCVCEGDKCNPGSSLFATVAFAMAMMAVLLN